MGYCIKLIDSKFRIDHDKVSAAKKALQAAFRTWQAYSTFAEGMAMLCWPVRRDDEGHVISISFNGEKLWEEKRLFTVLAPYVNAGSYLTLRGEDGHEWTWLFDGEKLTTRAVPYQSRKEVLKALNLAGGVGFFTLAQAEKMPDEATSQACLKAVDAVNDFIKLLKEETIVG